MISKDWQLKVKQKAHAWLADDDDEPETTHWFAFKANHKIEENNK
jgi:hypothetical protein